MIIKSGYSKDEVYSWVKRLQENAPGASEFHVVQSFVDLPKEEQVQLLNKGVGLVEGLFCPSKDQVFMVADNIYSKEQAVLTWTHEQGVHNGLRKMYKSNFEKFLTATMESIDETDPYYLDRFARKFLTGVDTNQASHRLIACEEFLARLGEKILHDNPLDEIETSTFERFKLWFKNNIVMKVPFKKPKFNNKEIALILESSIKNVMGQRSIIGLVPKRFFQRKKATSGFEVDQDSLAKEKVETTNTPR